ncbi:hypothetical protein AZE42_08936 [Rhizopogon vesiculosus]|uniref:Anaphase-promoting complex subunit 4 WD40 domain-containing protein n=1 Tax=Rhizopogon vesiculosus TaxID=180088 RepID=A0A1J8QXD2_9AGAM|nr:hypothetical protein AZE42_08936 [Rhizopogon vesiculosus]
MDNKLLASGSWDSAVRIWDLNTGELVAGPFECVNIVHAVRFSQNSKKLAVKSCNAHCLEVWDLEAQKLDVRVGKLGGGGLFPDAPVFWTKKDRTIVAAIRFKSEDDEDQYGHPTTIYEFGSSTLETVGAPFEAHTGRVIGLALSFDCALLASASNDTIKLWAFESRQLLASFDQLESAAYSQIILSPDSRQLACMTFEQDPNKIHICDIPPEILASIWPASSVCIHPHSNIHPLLVC